MLEWARAKTNGAVAIEVGGDIGFAGIDHSYMEHLVRPFRAPSGGRRPTRHRELTRSVQCSCPEVKGVEDRSASVSPPSLISLNFFPREANVYESLRPAVRGTLTRNHLLEVTCARSCTRRPAQKQSKVVVAGGSARITDCCEGSRSLTRRECRKVGEVGTALSLQWI